jgi:hypothetical protein
MKYLVVDSNSQIVNVIAWDGVTAYDPGAGLQLIGVDESIAVNSGDSWNGSQVVPAPMPEPVVIPEDPNKVSARAKLAALGLTDEEISAIVGG